MKNRLNIRSGLDYIFDRLFSGSNDYFRGRDDIIT